jgi:electron transfer flavoprotein alpha subunit
MVTIFVYSEHISLCGELIALVKELGQEVRAVSLNETDADELVKYGADKVYVLKGDSPRPENYAKAIASLLTRENPAAFFVGATVRGRDVAAQVAGHLKCGLVSDAARVSWKDGMIEADRMMYGGAVVQSESLAALAVITISAGKYEAVKDEGRSGEISAVPSETDPRVRQINVETIAKQGTDITKAAKIVCVGMGFDKKEDLHIAEDLAHALGAEIASTRAIAEDRKWLASETYIGLSGAVIRPDLYIGLGVSGQIQHTYGIREAKVIVGINNNPKATIFQVADYGIVGDLYEIAPVLTRVVKDR